MRITLIRSFILDDLSTMKNGEMQRISGLYGIGDGPSRRTNRAALLSSWLLGTLLLQSSPGIAAGGDAAGFEPPSPSDELAAIVVTARRQTELSLENERLDRLRGQNLLPPLGATTYTIDSQAVEALPQGKNTPLDKVLLQAPGVSYDSAISNPDFHVRNEYSNVQYRINGIQLPDGVSALGPVLETGFIGNLNLLDGALPAQYGLRTAGVVDITTKTEFLPGGNLDLYGGSWATLAPSVEYGGESGRTQYFVTARYLQSNQGLENATPLQDPIHDHTTQQKFFGYGSSLIGDESRLTYAAGAFVGHFQIPDVVGETPLGDFGPATLSSTALNENETDRFFFAVLALQTHTDSLDTQLSLSSRYATVSFVPDVFDDLAFNDVAANVMRKSLLNGLQFDLADRLSEAHTLRAGLVASVEKTQVQDLATVLPLDGNGDPLSSPVSVNDYTTKTGWNAGAYVQDEWRLFPGLSVNVGLRFDELNQFVTANQLSPRLTVVYQPFSATTVHAGFSRYFTPPMQAQATPSKLGLFQGTTQQAVIPLEGPVRPERASYYDIGVDQVISSALRLGVDAYAKRSTDTLDDGQFGQAVALNEYNYAHGFSRGVEAKLDYRAGGLRAYANASYEITMVKDVISNQYLIDDPVELAYLASNYTYASDAQTVTASAGASYRWQTMQASLDGIYGSGLRAGFANEQHTPGYTQWNAAIARYFTPWGEGKPLSVRLSVLNLFDHGYLLRGATGVGEFAPQYGPRRGVFLDVNEAF